MIQERRIPLASDEDADDISDSEDEDTREDDRSEEDERILELRQRLNL
jgi:hypothetical protein